MSESKISLNHWIYPDIHTGLDPYVNWIEWHNPNTIGFDNHFKLYLGIVKWINDNVNDYFENCQWTKVGDCIYVRFKDADDYVRFMLKWS